MDPEIKLTSAAIKAAYDFQANNETYRGKPLRLYLSGKGCDGFEYGVTFDDQDAQDIIIQITQDLKLVCDEQTLEFTNGSEIDWVDDERGRGFLVNNPNHRKFRGKFYKREIWRQKLTGKAESENQTSH